MQVKVYHNPDCSKSRAVLQLLQEAGIRPEVIEYLKTPLSRGQLRQIMAQTALTLPELLRTDDALFRDLGLSVSADDDTLLAAVEQYPALLNRPIVITAKGARLCRPPERVLEIL